MSDFNLEQMKHLLGKDNVSIVYLHAAGDYWIKQEEFCDAFRQVPLTNDVVIHVQFEGLSLTHALVVPAVEKIIEETSRNSNTVYIFSPNAIHSDAPWKNLYWKQFHISDEFTRSKTYWSNSPLMADNFKTWALFVGRRTTPRLLALYDIWHDPILKNNFLLSAMNQLLPEAVLIFDHPEKIYDKLDDWLLLPDKNKIQRIIQHNDFRNFCQNLPISSIDNYCLPDQYVNTNCGENRNSSPSKSLIKLGSKYLFELTFETMTRGFTFTPSEKTIRTILAEKPLMVYAPRKFLANLRALGFRTFDNLWDESYDDLEGPDRYRAIMKIVKEICMLSDEQQLQLYQQSRNTCEYNHFHLLKIVTSGIVKVPLPYSGNN